MCVHEINGQACLTDLRPISVITGERGAYSLEAVYNRTGGPIDLNSSINNGDNDNEAHQFHWLLRQSSASSDASYRPQSDGVEKEDYLEKILLRKLKSWITSSLNKLDNFYPSFRTFRLRTISKLKDSNQQQEYRQEMGVQRQNSFEGPISDWLSEEDAEPLDRLRSLDSDANAKARVKLINVLELSKLFNAIMLVCQSALLVEVIDLADLRAQAKTLSFQNLYSRFIILFDGYQQASSTSRLDAANQNLISYYLLAVSLLDLLNNLYWYHSKDTIVPTSSRGGRKRTEFWLNNELSWLRSSLNLVISPRHMFQLVYAGLLASVGGPLLASNMGLAIIIYNCLVQVMRHAYNCYRVSRYQRLVGCWRKPGQLDEDGDNDDEDEGDDRVRCRDKGAKAGWTYWPVNLSSCKCEFGETYLYQWERIQMMCQMLNIKMTIFNLLLQIDSLPTTSSGGESSFDALLMFACLFEAFLTMHSYYDKFHSRYLRSRAIPSSGCIGGGGSNSNNRLSPR